MAGLVDGYDWLVFGGNPVPGDPEVVRATAGQFRDLADQVGLQNRLLSGVGSDSESVWTGEAADAFRSRLGGLPPELERFVGSYRSAADALDVYWPCLRDAQELAVEAWHRATTAQTDIASAQALLTQAEQQTAAAANAYNQASVGHDYAPDLTSSISTQMAALETEYQLASARQWQATQALSAANASLQAARVMADHARSQAETAAGKLAATLRSVSYGGVPGRHHSWFSSIVDDVEDVAKSAVHQMVQFDEGLYDGIEQPLVMLAKLGDPLTSPEEALTLLKGVAYGFAHPKIFGEALIDWKDVSDGNYARWLGNLTPAIIGTVLTAGAGGAVKGADTLATLDRVGNAAEDASIVARGAEAGTLNSSNELMGIEPAPQDLLNAVAERRTVVCAKPGSDDLAYLDAVGAEANVGGEDMTHILLRENPSKAAVLEEFLHGTQAKLGIISRLGLQAAESHVKDFMIRYQGMLGLSNDDIQILKILRDKGL